MSAVEHEPQTTEYMPFSLRPMLPEDTAAVSEIEREAFPTTWPPTPFRKELNNRLARYLVACLPMDEVAANDLPMITVNSGPSSSLLKRLLQGVWPRIGKQVGDDDPQTLRWQVIPGFAGMWFMAGEAHIIAIAVCEAYRGRGIGELLLIGSVELAILRKAHEVTLEVRISNDQAQALYKKYGFEVTGVRKRYYTDNNEDAYIMTTGAIQTFEYQRTFQALVDIHARRWGVSDRVLTTPSREI